MIEIHQPELEALIMERLQTGAFQNVEEVLYQALTQAPLSVNPRLSSPTTADIFAAFRRSPFKDVDIAFFSNEAASQDESFHNPISSSPPRPLSTA